MHKLKKIECLILFNETKIHEILFLTIISLLNNYYYYYYYYYYMEKKKKKKNPHYPFLINVHLVGSISFCKSFEAL